MQSVDGPGGRQYDYGTHFVSDTGIADIDRLLVDGLESDDWWQFSDSLREGHVFGNGLYAESGCIDARPLPVDIFRKGFAELLTAPSEIGSWETLAGEVGTAYGETFRENIFRPVMRKLTGLELEALAPGALVPFSLGRLIVANSDASKALKKVPHLDDRIAYSRYTDGRSNIRKFYPHSGGVGRWIDYLETRLAEAGVDVCCETHITSFRKSGGVISRVQLSNGRALDCDLLAWTLPASMFAGLAQLASPAPPERLISLHLYHYLVDAPVNTDLHWVSVYREDLLTYRITLYPNIRDTGVLPAPHHLTAEVLSHDPAAEAVHTDRVFAELKDIGVLPAGAAIVDHATSVHRNAIPVLTPGFLSAQARFSALIEGYAENFLPLGRANGEHFQRNILVDTHDRLMAWD